MPRKMNPLHPGEVLREEFLEPLGLTAYRIAKDIDVPANRIGGIVNEGRAITADTALRLSRYFKTTPEFWMNLQAHYDLTTLSRSLTRELGSIRPHAA